MTKEKIESIRERMCDEYCKFPGWKLNDIGIAERVLQKICEYCPLNELEDSNE